MSHPTALQITEKAVELGYDKCGIIPLSRMAGYEEKLEERMHEFPDTKSRYEKFRSFAAPEKQYPWAKAIIVCSFWYGCYRIPKDLEGKIAKYYLTDGRKKQLSPGYQTSAAFEAYLTEQGLRIAFDRLFGITALRWAAKESGIGIVRKNNFFYTEKGSWQYLEAYLIDQPLQYIHKCNLRPCGDTCKICERSCPTKSLTGPYSMNRNRCISDLTTWSGWDLTVEPLHGELGNWIYGCDVCQNVCPYNSGAWTEENEFPGLDELSRHLSLEEIVEADYSLLERYIQPALWYIPIEKCWKYKVNAMNAMLNQYEPKYRASIQKACQDEKEPVRNMAAWVLKELKDGDTVDLLTEERSMEK